MQPVASRISSWLRRVARRRTATYRQASPHADTAYAAYRHDRLAARDLLYPRSREPGLLSYLTTVWDTDATFLDALAGSLLPQLKSHEHEWVLLDNGSSAPATLRSLRALRGRPGVRLLRTERNLGIVGGMRYCLQEARGRYVVPVDSDDWLYPDCARLLTACIRAHGYPPLVYTDEDKLDGETYFQPYFKPDWDPVLFVNSCYIAHLTALDRALALELGVYSDATAEGCHDWDSFMRFYLAGYTPRHLPEVVYSWRVHDQSTSAHIGSKDYIHRSHEAVLSRFLAQRGDARRFSLELSPLFLGTPDRWFRRMRVDPRPIVTAVLGANDARQVEVGEIAGGYPLWQAIPVPEGDVMALRGAAEAACKQGALLHLLAAQAEPAGDEWPWEALGLMELFPDTAMVGGRISGSDGLIRAAGSYFGYGAGCDCPDRGRPIGDPGYFAQMWKPHAASAVSAQHAVVDPSFLLDALATDSAAHWHDAQLGAWLGLHARRMERRVLYSPFIEARSETAWGMSAGSPAQRAFVAAAADVIPDTRLLSPRLGLGAGEAYRAVSDKAREAHLTSLGLPGSNARRSA